MSKAGNVAASVRARLLNLARENDEDYNRILLRYVQERLLFRLAKSTHANHFVLKGAALFSLWDGQPHRPTKDTDFLGFGEPDPARLREMFVEIVAVPCTEDGLQFNGAGIAAEPIREQARYDGIRVNIPVSLERSGPKSRSMSVLVMPRSPIRWRPTSQPYPTFRHHGCGRNAPRRSLRRSWRPSSPWASPTAA